MKYAAVREVGNAGAQVEARGGGGNPEHLPRRPGSGA